MGKNNMIKFMVTSEQKEKILRNAQINGYATISDYLRNIALNSNLIVRIFEIVEDIQKSKSKK